MQDTFKPKGCDCLWFKQVKIDTCRWYRCDLFKCLYGVYLVSSVMDNKVF